MRHTCFSLLCLLSLSLFAVGNLSAGELEPAFAEALKKIPPGQMATGVVHMKDRVDLDALTRSLLFPVRVPAATRHELVIRTLQEKAEETQGSLIRRLEGLITMGDVRSYQAFWIANAVGVTAEPSVFYELAARDDVGMVYANRQIELIKPVKESSSLMTGRGVEPGITATRAPELWAMGIRGQGAIACNIDTGVDGNHPGLKTRWRGLDPGVTSQEAWFDPVTHTTKPQDFQGHGTHTMGTICGDDLLGNQVGMAPDAKWIAAATIDRVSIPQTKIDAYASFQWCADPDGNPTTFDDVPAVSSNSWGLSPLYHGVPKGDPYFYDAIDGCEAAGCAVVFAAGNEGYYGPESLRTPADRIASPVSVLSVGALNSDQQTLASFSSQGPSGVDHFTIKPEVVAQGDNVRSCTIGGGYGNKSGTSMSCPHVAGAVVLLKSAFPDATAYELKAALLYTARDLGPAGEDNQYGRGIIDMVEAYNFLSQTLIGDTMEMSTTSGQKEVIFSLHGGAANGGREYVMLGSAHGTSPGLPLPGGLVLPLNWDAFSQLTLAFANTLYFQNFHDNLDATGTSVAKFNIDRPNPAYVGLVLDFAFCTIYPPGYDFVSNAWRVELTP